MTQENLLFEFKAESAAFRVADANPPLEEVTIVGTGRFKGKRLTTLYTVKIKPTRRRKDRQVGAGILYLEGRRQVYLPDKGKSPPHTEVEGRNHGNDGLWRRLHGSFPSTKELDSFL